MCAFTLRQRTLSDLKKVPDVAYQDNLNKTDSKLGGVKCLIVIHNNLVVTWKVRLWMGIISWFLVRLRWFTWVDCILDPLLQLNLQFVPKKIKISWAIEIIHGGSNYSYWLRGMLDYGDLVEMYFLMNNLLLEVIQYSKGVQTCYLATRRILAMGAK